MKNERTKIKHNYELKSSSWVFELDVLILVVNQRVVRFLRYARSDENNILSKTQFFVSAVLHYSINYKFKLSKKKKNNLNQTTYKQYESLHVITNHQTNIPLRKSTPNRRILNFDLNTFTQQRNSFNKSDSTNTSTISTPPPVLACSSHRMKTFYPSVSV